MTKFKTFSGVPTMPNGRDETLKHKSIIDNETVNESNSGLEKVLKILKKERKKRKKLKKLVEHAVKQENTKAIEKNSEKSNEKNTQTSINPIREKVGNFFRKLGDAIVKALPTVLVTVAGIAAKFFFGNLKKTKGAIT